MRKIRVRRRDHFAILHIYMVLRAYVKRRFSPPRGITRLFTAYSTVFLGGGCPRDTSVFMSEVRDIAILLFQSF